MIPFLNLGAQYAQVATELQATVAEVLASTGYVSGKRVAAFEAEFATFCNTRHAVAVNSGTSALHLAILAAGIGPGDEIITVSSTFVATVAAIEYAGATPVLVEVERDGLNIDPARIEAAITERTKAVMPVHLHGHPADMTPVLAVARRHGLTVIEDAAQAHGAEHHGERAGSIGDLGCFSFYPGKNLGACGEAGCVTTNDDELAARLRMLRDWGQSRKYHHTMKGFNYRMDEIQAAALSVKLRYLEEWTEGRRRVAARYRSRLAGSAVTLPQEEAYARHVYHVFGVRVADRDAVQESLQAAEIQTGIHYPIPVHMQPAFEDLGYREGDFPLTEHAATELLSLPMFPELTDAQVDTVCDALLAAVGDAPAAAAA